MKQLQDIEPITSVTIDNLLELIRTRSGKINLGGYR